MNKLIIGDSYHDMNLYYAISAIISDPVVYLETSKKKILVVPDFEYLRLRKECPNTINIEVYSGYNLKRHGLVDVAVQLLKKNKIKNIVMHESTKAVTYIKLKRRFKVKLVKNLYNRAIKTKDEIKKIRYIEAATKKAIDYAIRIIKKSRIKKNYLYYRGKRLSSAFIKKEIARFLLEYDLIAKNTIVACGKKSATPHFSGEQYLKPNQPIIIDVFPKSSVNNYYGDMTRTVCKGNVSAELKMMYNAVLSAQTYAISKVKEGTDTGKLYKDVLRLFKEMGFNTTKTQGFTHALGHGVGLNVHELPRIGKKGGKLKAGMVITIEPGLYYNNIGGVRIEDLLLVTKTGCVNLTNYKKVFEV